MSRLFGYSSDYEEIVFKSIETHIFEILEDIAEITLNDLFHQMIHEDNQYLSIKLKIEHILGKLVKNGSIHIDVRGNISKNFMTIIDKTGNIQYISVHDHYTSKEKENRKKEIFRIMKQSALCDFL